MTLADRIKKASEFDEALADKSSRIACQTMKRDMIAHGTAKDYCIVVSEIENARLSPLISALAECVELIKDLSGTRIGEPFTQNDREVSRKALAALESVLAGMEGK